MRRPGEILDEWTWLDVYEAHEVMNWNQDVRAYEKKVLEQARAVSKAGAKKR